MRRRGGQGEGRVETEGQSDEGDKAREEGRGSFSNCF